MRRGERLQIGIHHGALDHAAGDGIGTVEDDHGDVAAARLLQDVEQRRQVGVVAHADVLDVEDEHADAVEHVARRPSRRAVEAPDRPAGGRIAAVRHVRVDVATDAVLGREDRGEAHPGRIREEIDRSAALGVDARLVRDEPDGVALERGEVLVDQRVEAGSYGAERAGRLRRREGLATIRRRRAR